ncbi:hypothetical protein JB92DRAFT_3115677 [Gautieria morchelliformis]|nr:hypothetical protein JB92DRAFT_3115677 [Gautieria morchelliformis]
MSTDLLVASVYRYLHALRSSPRNRWPQQSQEGVATPLASLDVPADFTAQPFFVTDLLNVFYSGFGPSQTSVEPQPVMTDPVGNTVYPLNLTNPKTIPTANVIDPVVLPPSILNPSNSTVVSPPTQNQFNSLTPARGPALKLDWSHYNERL